MSKNRLTLPAPAAARPDLQSQLTTRRAFCRSTLATGSLVGAGLLPSAAIAYQDLDLANEAQLLQAMIKMRGSLDSKLVIGWMRAKRFAVSRGRVEPLCGLLAATFSRFRQLSPGLFEAVTLEITHYTDFNTGLILDELVMPFSEQKVAVPLYRFGPSRTRFSVRLEEEEEFAPQAGTTESAFAPAGKVLMSKSIHTEATRGGELFLRHEEHGRVYPNDSEIPSMFYKESTIWSAPAADVADPQTRRVNGHVSYSAMTSWRPWMKMGDLPGHTASNGFGAKVSAIADLPDEFLRYTQQRHPDVLENPEGILDSVEG